MLVQKLKDGSPIALFKLKNSTDKWNRLPIFRLDLFERIENCLLYFSPLLIAFSEFRNGWLIRTASKSFAVYAATSTEKQEWMAHINKCIEDLLRKSEYHPYCYIYMKCKYEVC